MVHPRGRDKALAVIEAYCDESGIHRGASYCVVVGLVGSARNWQRFEEQWRRASGGIDFHGKEFFARSNGERVGPYRGWNDTRARRYLLELVGVITATNFEPIGGVINIAAFEKLSLDQRRYLTGAAFRPRTGKFVSTGAPSKPFFVGFSECIVRGAKCVKKRGWKINFVWDRQNEFASQATLQFQMALDKGVPGLRESLGELTFKNKNGVGGLQAADLLAHAFYKRAGNNLGVIEELDMATLRLRPMTHNKIVHFEERTFKGRLALAGEYVDVVNK